MGPDSDPDVVVDSYRRVLEIKSLRVADASAMPLVPTVYTTAEKTADLVKRRGRLHSKTCLPCLPIRNFGP